MARGPAIGLLAAVLAATVAAVGACAQAGPQSAAAGPATGLRVALMPLEDFGEETGGAFQVQGLLERDLAALGYEVVDQAGLRRLLLRERVRRTGSVPRELARTIGADLSAPLLLIGAVTQYRTGTDPCVSIVCRIVEASSCRIVWTGAASATGDQFEKVLGLGRVNDPSRLTAMMVARLLGDLPAAPAMAARLEEVSR